MIRESLAVFALAALAALGGFVGGVVFGLVTELEASFKTRVEVLIAGEVMAHVTLAAQPATESQIAAAKYLLLTWVEEIVLEHKEPTT